MEKSPSDIVEVTIEGVTFSFAREFFIASLLYIHESESPEEFARDHEEIAEMIEHVGRKTK